MRVCVRVCRKTIVYRETLMKGKFDEFWPNRQTKTIQYKDTKYISKISAIIILLCTEQRRADTP